MSPVESLRRRSGTVHPRSKRESLTSKATEESGWPQMDGPPQQSVAAESGRRRATT
jgi:hypothetical protein